MKDNFPLGRFENVPLRRIWPHEATGFTPWLASPENLDLLGTTLGIYMERAGEEVAVGPFAADILCKDIDTGNWVVIENQFETTDHRHLGQLLTYASGLNAKTLIWIAEKFTEEHRAVLDWLNSNSGQGISFFGVELHLLRIGKSPPAPKFNVVCQPNGWSKAVRSKAGGTGAVTEQLRSEFCSEVRKYVANHSSLRGQKSESPSMRHTIPFTVGRSNFALNAVVALKSNLSPKHLPEFRVELVLNSRESDRQFAKLESRKKQFEASIDWPLLWVAPTKTPVGRIYVRRHADFRDQAQWSEKFEWFNKYLNRFAEVFKPVIKEL